MAIFNNKLFNYQSHRHDWSLLTTIKHHYWIIWIWFPFMKRSTQWAHLELIQADKAKRRNATAPERRLLAPTSGSRSTGIRHPAAAPSNDWESIEMPSSDVHCGLFLSHFGIFGQWCWSWCFRWVSSSFYVSPALLPLGPRESSVGKSRLKPTALPRVKSRIRIRGEGRPHAGAPVTGGGPMAGNHSKCRTLLSDLEISPW